MANSERELSGRLGDREDFAPLFRRFLMSTGVCLILLLAGIALRHGMWQSTAPIRFAPDLTAAWHWGTQAMQVGYLDLYDVVVDRVEDGNYILDYVPLRLLAVTAWVRVTSALHPEVTWWQPEWIANRWLHRIHTLMELLAAVGAFFLVRNWLRQCDGSNRILLRSLLAAAVVWLSPAMMINSHGRPGTDVWILPFYLWALWASVRSSVKRVLTLCQHCIPISAGSLLRPHSPLCISA